jgi:hypothetical protein
MTSLLRILVTGAAAVALIVPASASAAAAPHKMFWASPDMDGRDAFATLQTLGVDTYQTAINWAVIAPTKPADPENPSDPAYQWPAGMDETLAAAAAHKMDVAMMLVGTPGWANGDRGERYAPTSFQDFADFARAASRRYPQVKVWMIWGEPNFTDKFQPSTAQTNFNKTALTRAQQQGPRAYAKLLDAAYGALKAQERGDLVVGGMTAVTGDTRPVPWVRYMRLPNGKPPRMDLYGHNAFSARGPSLHKPPSPQGAIDFSDLKRFQKVVDRYLAKPLHKRKLRFYLSEFAVPTAPDSEFSFYTTPEVQARWITDGFKVAAKLGAYGLGWIHLSDDAPGGSTAGLLTADGKPKPGFAAFEKAR